jgi:hypothetical protein
LGLTQLNLNLELLSTLLSFFSNADYFLVSLLVPFASWKEERGDHYRRHHIVVKHIQANKEANIEILEKALCFDEYSQITEEHVALCLDIYNKRVSMPLPVPNTEHVLSFANLVGPEVTTENVPGCYLIKGPNTGRSIATGLENIESYVGQAKHLGNRVKDHAKKHDSTTKGFIKSLKGKGTVELFIVKKDLIIPEGLSHKQFISLLEQYLIIKLRPTINKKLIATPGVMWSPETTKKHLEKVANPIYAYRKEADGKMVLIQIFPSTRAVGLSIEKGKSFFCNIISRTNGWYKDKLYFSDVELENAEKNILSLLEFIQIVKELASIKKKDPTRVRVRVTDIITGEVRIHDSMCSVATEIGIDHKGIRDKSDTSKLYKRRYMFEILD